MDVIVTHKSESVIYNGKIYKTDDTFEVDEVIGKSLMERGYVAPVEYPFEDKTEGDDLEAMPYAELKKLAAEMGVSANGKKEELIARIRAAEQTAEEVEDENPEESDEASDDLPNTGMPE